MAETFSVWNQSLSLWIPFALSAILFLGLGLLGAKKLWGKNAKRLARALDDSAYLAGQWATLGVSQSQLVDKLDRKARQICSDYEERDRTWDEACRGRDLAISRLEQQIAEFEQGQAGLTEREVEALQIQVQEIEKRDHRIRTLEARLQYLDSQNEQNATEHQKQVQLLLDRISVLEEGSNTIDPELEANNQQLTELLKERCNELEALRDEFYDKEKDLTTLRNQNAALKESVDDVVAKWKETKHDSEEVESLREQLESRSEEIKQLRNDYDKKVAELDVITEERGSGEDWEQSLTTELASARTELDEKTAEVERSSSQVDMLLDVIETRDRRVDELERQLNSNSNSKQNQVEALSQTIADLRIKANETEEGLDEAREEIERLHGELGTLVQSHHRELRAKDEEIDLLKSNVDPDVLNGIDFEEVRQRYFESEEAIPAPGSRFLSETKSISGKRSGEPFQKGSKSVIYFSENSAFIKNENSEVIRDIAKDVLQSGCQISLVGFSEREGNAEFNESLSLRRAEAVREEFAEQGVDSNLVIVKGRGEDEEYSQSGDSWKARRVEIVILPVAEIIN